MVKGTVMPVWPNVQALKAGLKERVEISTFWLEGFA
jgi:hypothetical protein